MYCIACKKEVEKIIAINMISLLSGSNMQAGECINCAEERYHSLLKMENDLPWKDGEYVDGDGITVKMVRPSETLAQSIKQYRDIS